MSAGVRSAFTGISAGEQKKKFHMAQWGQRTAAPGPLAPYLVGSSQDDSLVRVLVLPVMHLMNIKIMYLAKERYDSLRSWFLASCLPLLDYYPSRQFASCRKFLKCHMVIMSLSGNHAKLLLAFRFKFSEKVVDGADLEVNVLSSPCF